MVLDPIKQSSEVSIKARSTPASLSFTGQVTKHTTVKWSIVSGQHQHTRKTSYAPLVSFILRILMRSVSSVFEARFIATFYR